MKKAAILFSLIIAALGNIFAQETIETEVTAVVVPFGENVPASGNIRTGKRVYSFPIREDIMPATARLTAKCLSEAGEMGADYIVIDMNTYGGLLDAADTIRTMLINCQIPVLTFVNNQAASAGALIAIASDSIYMRPGASMGAATVVDQGGEVLPDKYQSFMRSIMRATAESHGKVPVEGPGGDITWQWRRDPQIAQAMVDPSIVVPGLVDETKVVTFTPEEAMKWGYCEGTASSVREVLSAAGVDDYELVEYERTWLDKLFGFLSNPVFQSIFIMMIIGGIWFEMQTPGVGLPLIIAILGAVLYFSPLYVEGLVANWEIVAFVIGLVLIAVEIFVTPGFGVIGILGIISVVAGLVFALIDTDLLKYIPTGELPASIVLGPLATVVIAVTLGVIVAIWGSNKFLKGESRLRGKLVLATDMTPEEGFVGRQGDRELVGREAVAATRMVPTGKVVIDGVYYEAAGENAAFIEKGAAVTVARDEGGVLYVVEKR